MRILGAPLRGVLVPTGAAVAFILALTWYGMFWIPAQQHYLDESNLRLLRTMSAQIKARVDNFDQAIDHAIDSFLEGTDDGTAFNDYVQASAPELEILKKPSEAAAKHKVAEKLVYDRAGDPPRIVVRRDEGKSFVYLGYYRPEGNRTVVARGDIEKVAAPFLATHSQFDAVLLVDRDGGVITQRSPSGIELARVDDSFVPNFNKKRTASDIENVLLGSAPFKLYIQPIQLSLNRAEPSVADRDEPEEWTLCGLVRADHFRADSSAISYTYLLWFSAALALVFVAIPLLKLELLAPRQRLRDVDGVWVAVTTFLGAALLIFCVTDAYVFAVTFQATTDRQLKELATALKNHFDNELAAIDQQRKSFDCDAGIWRALNYDERHDLPYYQMHPPASHKRAADRPVMVLADGGCDPKDACQEGLFGLLRPNLLSYPFFERVVWYDATGQERIKWTTRKRVTPFIDLSSDAQLPDSENVLRAASSDSTPNGIAVILSPTTGDAVTALWRTLERPSNGGSDGPTSRLMGQWFSLGTPLSFRTPVLPPGFRFAVVNADGLVLYHSDSTRSLKQNFFEETENNPALRAAALGRHDDLVTGNYEGRRHRFQITPIDAGVSTEARRWSLIVFQETNVPETVNLEVLTLAVFVFLVYSAILVGVWGGAYFLWAGYPQKWFWPDHSSHLAYRKIVVVNVLLLTISLVWALFFDSTMLIVVGPVVFAFTGLGATFWMLRRNREREATTGNAAPGWRQSFYLARVSLVAILAVAPALACFRAAYEFETRLLIKSGQAGLAHQLDARKRLIAEEAERLQFCEHGKDCASDESLKRKKAFTDKRSSLALDIYVAPFFATCRGDVEEMRCDRVAADWRAQDRSLDRVFGIVHRSYNDVAVDLRAAIRDRADAPAFLRSDPSPTTALPGPGYWLYLALAVVGLYALVRHTAARLFILNLYEAPAADVVPESSNAGNALLIGPPGCGKTRKLLADPLFEVVDIRIKVLDERRERARSVDGDPSKLAQIVARAFGVPFRESAESQSRQSTRAPHEGSWADALLSTGKGAVAFDHFEYGFDDPDFRDQMLSVLEDLIYRQRRVVWIASTHGPWRRVHEQPEPRENGLSLPNRDRWVSVFKSFQKVNMFFKEDGASREPYYQLLWAGCSREEQLALRQLAEENIVNPNNESVLRRLVQDGLVFRGPSARDRTPIFRIVNETFERVILHAQSASTIAEWEREGVMVSWGTISTTLVTVAVGIVGLLLLTQQQLVEAWVGYIPTLAPAIPTALKVLGSFRRELKPDVFAA